MEHTNTQKRLDAYQITESENRLPSEKTVFTPYYFNSFSERARTLESDNIAILFTDLDGNALRPAKDGARWKKPYKRLRVSDENRYLIDGELSPKYLTETGRENQLFLTGLYVYFVEPLQAERDKQLQEALNKHKGKAYQAKAARIEKDYLKKLSDLFTHIVITEGEFKAFAACKAGIPTIGIVGIHGATKAIKKEVYGEGQKTVDAFFHKDLAALIHTYSTQSITYLQDSDALDNQNNVKRANSFFAAVRNFKQSTDNHNRGKDQKLKTSFAIIKSDSGKMGLDDLLMKHPAEAENIHNELLKNDTDKYFYSYPLDYEIDLNYIQSVFDQSTNEIVRIQGKQGDYVDELTTWEQVENSICIAPTGSGKTTFFAGVDGKKIVCCPVNSLMKDIVSNFPNAVEWSGEYKNLEAAKESDLIVTNYASFKGLNAALRHFIKDIHLIVDEVHSFTSNTSKGFQLKQLKKIIEAAPNYKSFTGFTGTDVPNAHPILSEMKRVIIDIPRPPATYEIIESAHTKKTAAVLLEKTIKEGKTLIILQNKTNKDKDRQGLKDFINREDVLYFDAQSKKDKLYKKFIRTGEIPDGCKGLVFTTVIETGFSIKTKGDFVYIILGMFNPLTIEQVRARTRNADSCHICLIKGINREKSEAVFNFHKELRSLSFACEKQCEALNSLAGLTSMEAAREALAREAIQSLPIFYNKDSDQYEVDLLRLSNQVFNFQTVAMYRNDELLKREFAKYQIVPVVSKTDFIDVAPTDEELQRVAIGRETLKAQNASDYSSVIDLLETKLDALTICKEALYLHGNTLSKAEKTVFKWFVILSEHGTQEQVLEWLRTYEKETQKRQLLQRLRVHAITSTPDHMAKNSAFVIFCKAMRDRFKAGDILTSDEAKERVLSCLRLDKTFYLPPFENAERNTKILKVLRLFFEVKNYGKKQEGRLKVGTLTLDSYITKPQVKVPDLPLSEALDAVLSLSTNGGYPAAWD